MLVGYVGLVIEREVEPGERSVIRIDYWLRAASVHSAIATFPA